MTTFKPGDTTPVKIPVVEKDAPLQAWSFSSLKVFETCAYRAYLKGVKKIKEPGSEAMDRGSAIHDLAENFIRGEIPFPKELEKLQSKYEALAESFDPEICILEDNWAFTEQWQPTDWYGNKTWNRTKLDYMKFDSPTSAFVVDHKTGAQFGNEMKHAEQLMLYAVICFVRYPDLEHVRVANYYTDQGEITERNYSRGQALVFLPRWTERGLRMTNATEFLPTPSAGNCRWCPYKEDGNCEWAEQ